MTTFFITCDGSGNGAIATFVYRDWVAAYPEFQGVSEPSAQGYFDLATTFFRNDGSGPLSIAKVGLQTTLLYMLTSHIAQLMSAQINGVPNSGGAPSPGLVGRISSASEGSVSVSVDLSNLPAAAAWFAQTKYGFLFWTATANLRTMRYVPAPRRNFGFGGNINLFCKVP